ncbi:MAG TPA: nucleotidyl transferase AbiEii/AbiGii toxin family protein [Solirubrobacteraceae bacterium]|nr:nucleotidyl transferase AbiEii/AbiGii toxin family protein [Solirubrobacteraceae bacterium]
MPAPDKPRHRSGYTAEETEQVKAVCLTLAVTLGAHLDDVCIVGGLVPPLIIDTTRTDDDDSDLHPGTNDLDIGLALALLNEERYAEISRRLRSEGFKPDTNEKGNPTVQRWRLGELKVAIDFLMPPAPAQDPALRVQNLEPDFGALVTPGLELAFDERVNIELHGHTLNGERARRTVPVCGAAAFVVLKALAFGDRGEPKDAYDLVYVIRHSPGRGTAIANRLRLHAQHHAEIVARALGLLSRDFNASDDIGPRRAAAFAITADAELDNDAADAHGFVDDLLRATARLGLRQLDA